MVLRKGKAVQDEPVMEIVAIVVWVLLLLGAAWFVLWEWSSFWDLFLPGWSWLP
jgi:hypothetical protein